MQDGGVGAAADDRRVPGPGAAVLAERVVDQRLDLVLARGVARGQHRGDVRLGGDLGGAALDRDLLGRLDQAHLVQRHARVDQPHRRARAAALGHPEPAEQPRHRRVERRLAPERVVDLLGARQDLGQLGVQLAGDERRVGAEVAHGALDARPPPGPGLLGRIARAHEHHEAHRLVPGAKHDHGAGLLEPGQVQDVAVLPELEVRVAVAQVLGRRRQHQRPVRSDPPHQLGAPFGVRRRRGAGAGGGDGRDGRDGHGSNSNFVYSTRR